MHGRDESARRRPHVAPVGRKVGGEFGGGEGGTVLPSGVEGG